MAKTSGKDGTTLLTGTPGIRQGAATRVVEVASKLGVNEAPGQSLLDQMRSIGVAGAREVRVSSLYEISGRLSPAQVDLLGRTVLCDPITQEFRLDMSASSPAFLIGPHWRVEVWLKPQVADPVGESVSKALKDMGLPEPESVRTGTAYQIVGRITQNQIDKVVNNLLAHPLIHRTKVAQL